MDPAEVVRYVLAIEATKNDESMQSASERLVAQSADALWAELEERFGGPTVLNRAATNLLQRTRFRWFRGRSSLPILRMRRNALSPDHLPKHPTVKQVADFYRATPATERSDTLRSFNPRPVPEDRSTLVVHQEQPGATEVFIGDGYHRAVSLLILGEAEAEVYFGECQKPAEAA